MAMFKRVGVSPTKQPSSLIPHSSLDLAIQVELWNAGLLILELPPNVQPRSLTPQEIAWLDRVAQAEYLDPHENGLSSVFYTAPPPDFDRQQADWYLRPSWYWNQAPLSLVIAMQQFPIEQFQLMTSGQPPAFYPEQHSGYTLRQEKVMRQIFRETVRIGWSLPDYKWYVMQQFHKTTATVTEEEAQQILTSLQQVVSSVE